MELFEKEAMAWDTLQMRCTAPVGAQKGEGSGRPKRKPDRKTKRSQGEKKANGRALKAAKLTHNQTGPSLAVNKIRAKEERVMEVSRSLVRVATCVSGISYLARGLLRTPCRLPSVRGGQNSLSLYLSHPVSSFT